MIIFYITSIFVAICDKCGKYFIPKNKSNEKYCDNLFKDNKSSKKIAYQLNKKNYARKIKLLLKNLKYG